MPRRHNTPPAPEACPRCGLELPDSARYCPRCGEPVAHASAAAPAPADPDYDLMEAPSSRYDDDRDGGRYDDEGGRSGGGGGCLKAFLVSFFAITVIGAAAYWYYTTYMLPPDTVTISQRLRQAAASYDELGEFYDGVAQARRDGNIYYIDTDGNPVDPPAGADPDHRPPHAPDATTLVRIESGGRWGMIDRTTRDTVIPPRYSTLGNFHDGLALATLKFGDPSMPEYVCFYGYVDQRGAHTFTPEQFERVSQAARRAERREYIESLPQGVTARTLGLPAGTREARCRADSGGSRWLLRFDRQGVLVHYEGPGAGSYGVSGGFVTSMTSGPCDDGVIRSYRFEREPLDELTEAIYRRGSDGRRRVGTVTYSADDHTVTAYTLEGLPSPLPHPDITRW